MLLPHMSKQLRVSRAFVPREVFIKIEHTLAPEYLTIDSLK